MQRANGVGLKRSRLTVCLHQLVEPLTAWRSVRQKKHAVEHRATSRSSNLAAYEDSWRDTFGFIGQSRGRPRPLISSIPPVPKGLGGESETQDNKRIQDASALGGILDIQLIYSSIQEDTSVGPPGSRPDLISYPSESSQNSCSFFWGCLLTQPLSLCCPALALSGQLCLQQRETPLARAR